jgi:glutathione peroxidase
MSLKQNILKAMYPLTATISKVVGKFDKLLLGDVDSITPIYNYEFAGISGTGHHMSDYKGKKILIVNTASDCGYTQQYGELEKLHQQYKDSLVVIAFPANDFKDQEKGGNEEIASFCKKNYGVTFPLARKTKVIASRDQHPIFTWLSNKDKNGWNNQAPSWNFCKYLLDEKGNLILFAEAAVSPLDKTIIDAIKN